MYIKPQGVIFGIQNTLKFTYRNLEFPNFPVEWGRRRTPGLPLFRGGKEREGGEGKEGALPWLQQPGPVGRGARISIFIAHQHTDAQY